MIIGTYIYQKAKKAKLAKEAAAAKLKEEEEASIETREDDHRSGGRGSDESRNPFNVNDGIRVGAGHENQGGLGRTNETTLTRK